MKYRIFDTNNKRFLPDSILLDSNLVMSSKGMVMRAIGSSTHATLENMSDHLIAQQSTGFFHNGVEVWEGDIFECEGAILKVEYCIKNATYMLSTKQGHVWNVMFLPYLKAYESIVDYIGNVLTHPELWEVAE